MQDKASPRCTLLLLLSVIFLFSFSNEDDSSNPRFPYKKAGLNERQAAAHLLNRFTFGAKPGQVDEVIAMGLENWFLRQLNADLPDEQLALMLAAYPSLSLSNEEIIKTFGKPGQILRMAIRDGAIDKNAVNKDDQKAYRRLVTAYMQQHGFKPQRDLYRELINQKIVRAAYSGNQLQEVLTSFWFNHFNVSLTDKDCARFIMTYERDAIRPHVLGRFETLLLATAQSPAMLTYLDNFRSTAPGDSSGMASQSQKRRMQGLNENYAREIMELHTLGVDGGYTQHDVTEAARIFTGWTVYPALNDYYKRKNSKRNIPSKFSRNGFVRDGDFFFASNRHDNGKKVVMGEKFPANGGFQEGMKLIKMLATHPATARFISLKLAVRFQSDSPPESLVDEMATTFMRTEGDIKAVLTTLVSASEFWTKEALREKIKTPFELAISSARGLNAEIPDPYPLYGWISRMGEKMYAYQAPTGFPDKGQYWINTGSLLTRMNFGLALASGNIKGMTVDLGALNQNREPESAEQALNIYSGLLMQGRDLEETIKRLTPALSNPEFTRKVNQAGDEIDRHDTGLMWEGDSTLIDTGQARNRRKRIVTQNTGNMPRRPVNNHNRVLEQVVGLIIGSPEFQRR